MASHVPTSKINSVIELVSSLLKQISLSTITPVLSDWLIGQYWVSDRLSIQKAVFGCGTYLIANEKLALFLFGVMRQRLDEC